MDTDATEPKSHLVGRIREALAEDARTNMLDVQVTYAGGKIFLLGRASTAELREAAEHVVRELLPSGVHLVNALAVSSLQESTEREWLP